MYFAEHLLSSFILLLCLPFNFTHDNGVRLISPEIQEKIDDFIEDVFLPLSGVSGLGLAVVQSDGELLYTTGYGNADHEKGIRNDNQTQFLLGSVTKTFTSLLVVKTLHENFPEMGEAVLDTPIQKLLPEANFTLKDRFRSEQATFRDLLAHRMCIPRSDFQLMTEPFDTTKEILRRQSFADEACGFRTQFMYNNHMVLYAAELVSQLQKQTFEEMAEDFLKELGMFESSLVKKEVDTFDKRAKPYYVVDGGKAKEMNPELLKRLTAVQSIGGLYVTPNDMARFLAFQMNKGAVDGNQIIPEHVMNWIIRASTIYSKIKYKTKSDEIFETPLAYGLGVSIESYNSWQRFSHNGYFTPYGAELSWYPGRNLGIFTSTHEAPTRVKLSVLHAFILETLLEYDNAAERALKSLENQRETWTKNQMGKTKALETFMEDCRRNEKENHTVADWPKLLGIYGNDVSGNVEISERYNPQSQRPELYLSYGKWAKGWLKGVGDDAYKINWETDIAQDFYAGGDQDGSGYVYVRLDGSLDFVRPTAFGVITYAQFLKDKTIK